MIERCPSGHRQNAAAISLPSTSCRCDSQHETARLPEPRVGPCAFLLSALLLAPSSQGVARGSADTLFGSGFEAIGNQLWVDPTGNDGNSCQFDNPCRTIQRGISLLEPGDTLNIRAGTYIERSDSSPDTAPCSWGGTTVSLCIPRSGTPMAPITIQAAPGAERQVVLDNEGTRAAIHLLSNDYIAIRGLLVRDSYKVGLVNWGQAQNEVAEESGLSVGILVQENRFENTSGPAGDNISSIAMWGSKDWVVLNNEIDGVTAVAPTLASGIQSYGVINALIENNTIRNVDFGIFWKDHFVQDLATRTPWQESEIRFNDISARDTGVRVGIRGSGSVEAGNTQVHHNIIRAPNGFLGGMAGAHSLSADLRIEHNVFDAEDAGGSACVSADSFRSAVVATNIMVRCDIGLELIDYSDGGNNYVRLTESNRNVWDVNFQIIVDRYSGNTGVYGSLPTWRAVLSGQRRTVHVDHPDAASVAAAFAALFANTTNYRNLSGSPAVGLAGPGRNAGPYEFGNEHIGAYFQGQTP